MKTRRIRVRRLQSAFLICLALVVLYLWSCPHQKSSRESLHQRLPRLLCWVPTGEVGDRNRAVRDTWGRRCGKLIFFTPKYEPALGNSVVLEGVREGKNFLWGKTKAALTYLHRNHLEEFDFFLKADDDTFVVVENLLWLLSGSHPDPEEPVFLGQRFHRERFHYMTGGAGYVLSRGALRLFAEKGFSSSGGGGGEEVSLGAATAPCISPNVEIAEDLAMGDCMFKLRVPFKDAHDSEGRGRFFQLSVEEAVLPGGQGRGEYYHLFSQVVEEEGLGCCAADAVSFHHVDPGGMYAMEYLIYHLRVRGEGSERLD